MKVQVPVVINLWPPECFASTVAVAILLAPMILRKLSMKLRGIGCAVLMVAGAGLVWIPAAQAATGNILMDFGSDGSYRGVSAPSPDRNGHYRNSLVPGVPVSNLVDENNLATTADLVFSMPVCSPVRFTVAA